MLLRICQKYHFHSIETRRPVTTLSIVCTTCHAAHTSGKPTSSNVKKTDALIMPKHQDRHETVMTEESAHESPGPRQINEAF
jgi:hypothetical protein